MNRGPVSSGHLIDTHKTSDQPSSQNSYTCSSARTDQDLNTQFIPPPTLSSSVIPPLHRKPLHLHTRTHTLQQLVSTRLSPLSELAERLQGGCMCTDTKVGIYSYQSSSKGHLLASLAPLPSLRQRLCRGQGEPDWYGLHVQ